MAARRERISDKGVTMEVCLAAEMAAEPKMPALQFDNCSVKQSPMVGSTVCISRFPATIRIPAGTAA